MDNNQNVVEQQMSQQPKQPEKNSLAVAGLVLGIVSVVFSFAQVWIGLITGIVAIVLSVKGRKIEAKKGMATAGMVLGIVGTSLSGLFVACALCAIGAANSIISSM